MATTSEPTPICVLCGGHTSVTGYHQDRQKVFWHCSHCDLVFLDPRQRLGAEDERARYLSHNNDPKDERYQRYLAKMLEPVWQKYPRTAPPGSRAMPEVAVQLLDYGCGPTRGVEEIWSGSQLQVTSYDPIFFPMATQADHRFDVIICCEAAEHFYEPAAEFERMSRWLKPDGLIVLRTGWRPPTVEAFARWGYHHDPTHVCFYSLATMDWLRLHWQLPLHLVK